MRCHKILTVAVIVLFSVSFFSCEKETLKQQAQAPAKVSGTISKSPTKALPAKPVQNKPKTSSPAKIAKPQASKAENKSPILKVALDLVPDETLKYDPKGRVDPFVPLIQDKEETPAPGPLPQEKPKRILTPLEKMDLSQLRLVAVILMDNKKIAMVEEATGKGYEVGIGTYMGKNSGKVSQINPSSIIIREIVKDYKGKRKERFQEMKLHKRDSGE